jgi:GTPase Era involved in 16S rRNA processing
VGLKQGNNGFFGSKITEIGRRIFGDIHKKVNNKVKLLLYLLIFRKWNDEKAEFPSQKGSALDSYW